MSPALVPAPIARWLDARRDWGALAIRIFAGTFLVYMSQDNVFSAERMREFESFLAARGVASTALAARTSVYAQFGAGIAFLLGALTRPAAAIMIVNFLAALWIAHVGTPFRTWLEPFAMLASAVMLLLHGPGPLAIDGWAAQGRPRARGAGVP